MYPRWIRKRTKSWKPSKSECPAQAERSPTVKVRCGLHHSNFQSLESILLQERLCSSSQATVAMRSESASDRCGSRISAQAQCGVWIRAVSRRQSHSDKSATSPPPITKEEEKRQTQFGRLTASASSDGRIPKRLRRHSSRFTKDFGEMALARVADLRADLGDRQIAFG